MFWLFLQVIDGLLNFPNGSVEEEDAIEIDCDVVKEEIDPEFGCDLNGDEIAMMKQNQECGSTKNYFRRKIQHIKEEPCEVADIVVKVEPDDFCFEAVKQEPLDYD